MGQVILILYTTLYRKGGALFKEASETLMEEKKKAFPLCKVICEAVESKKDFIASIEKVARNGERIRELHFTGHSGMYGIMFGTTDWPEQFSPHEWRNMKIPFSKDGEAFFHACRSGRWFAPFFARTFGVPSRGYHWYTTFSSSRKKYVTKLNSSSGTQAVYVVSCPGKKSHGIVGTFLKHSRMAKCFPMERYEPEGENINASYDPVAELYDKVFPDISVRKDEIRWLDKRLKELKPETILDIGCGNGALLSRLAPHVEKGTGVDLSSGMIECARKRNGHLKNLHFKKIDGPHLPFPDNSFHVVTSLLSFRYLDWDPVITEILRVLKPGGHFLVIDMAAAPVSLKEIPAFLLCKIKMLKQQKREKAYVEALRRMVSDERWKHMLKYNPIRAEHEYRWYLESRFPPNKVEKLNLGWSSRVLAFDSGPVTSKFVEKMSYP